MAEQCMSIFERDQLPAAANVEQCCATGLTAEGKTPKSLVEDMVPLLDSRDVRSVRAAPPAPAPVRADGGARSNTSKVRIIALYILHRDGVPDEDRRRLYQHARLSLAEQDAVNALALLGARISRGPGDRDTRRKLRAWPAPVEARCLTAGSRALPDGLRDPPARRPYQDFHVLSPPCRTRRTHACYIVSSLGQDGLHFRSCIRPFLSHSYIAQLGARSFASMMRMCSMPF
jgi:hypothetical protein